MARVGKQGPAIRDYITNWGQGRIAGRHVGAAAVRGHADFFDEPDCRRREYGWVSEESCNAGLMPPLSKQSDTTIEAQRDV